MEYYQAIQNRAAQTAAVIKQYFPETRIGDITAAGLLEKSQELGKLAQARDDALAAFDAADNAESQGFLALKALTFSLPRIAQGELDDQVGAESALLDLLSPVYSVEPRNTELVQKRGKKLISALARINDYFASLTPPRAPVSGAGGGVGELSAAIDAQAVLAQALEDRTADVSAARSALRTEATALDRLNKRFYAKLRAAAHTDEMLTKALAQIDTGSANLPATLGIRTILQGGTDNRQVLVSYVSGSYDDGATSTLEWKVGAGDTPFSESIAVDPSGNAIGPFSHSANVQLRTRVTNGNGTTTGSVRTLVIN